MCNLEIEVSLLQSNMTDNKIKLDEKDKIITQKNDYIVLLGNFLILF